MPKHHHQSREEQLYNKEHGAAPFHHEKTPHPRSPFVAPENIPTKAAVDDRSIQLQAYLIYQEKGGSDLDNWLEAERILRNNYHQ